MEDTHEQLLSWVQMGEEWVAAITRANFGELARWVDPAVHCRLITPKRISEVDGADSLIEKVHGWFEDVTSFRIIQTRAQPVGERLSISYRLLLEQEGRCFQVEQQVFASLRDGAMVRVDLLCSGFQPVSEQKTVQPADIPAQLPVAGRLVFDSHAETAGSTCALLTPAIREKLRGMASGQVLEVVVDDRSARSDIEAWSRLSGNPLVQMDEDPDQGLRFLLAKK
jgi:TusA-related sulfurtransferase